MDNLFNNLIYYLVMAKNIIGKFEDITALHEYLNAAKSNKHFEGRESSLTGGHDFCGSDDMPQAHGWLVNGYSDIAVPMQHAIRAAEAAGETGAHTTRRRQITSVAGNRVNVARYLAGNPVCMTRTIRAKVPAPVVTIVYNSGAVSAYTADEIFDAAVKVLLAAIKIEKQGIRVNLYAATISESNRQYGGIILRVKSADQPLNVLKTAYPLCHPSMLRRHKFRYIETHPDTPRHWLNGYGRSVERAGLVDALRQEGIRYDAALTFYDVHGSGVKVDDIVNKMLKK